MRNFYEPRFGYDFNNVKVHTDTVAAKSAQSINALAFTSGNNIVFNNGQYSPDTDSGKRLLGHELTHVVQQRGSVNRKKLQRVCQFTGTLESDFAANNPGKVFTSGDKATEPNELQLWNYCTAESSMRKEHENALLKEIPRWKKLMTGSGANNAVVRSDLKIKVQGTASQSGNRDANEELALDRANAVKDFLVVQGLPDFRIVVEGINDDQPMADETTPGNMARNRRVDVFMFTPTTTANIPGSLVDAQVSNLSIGKHPSAIPRPNFDRKANTFGRQVPSMFASADVMLTGFQGDSIGFLQFLTEDTRVAQYKSVKDDSGLLLDYGKCNTVLPCRDVLDGTSQFSIDSKSLFLSKTGTENGKVIIADSPGTGFTMDYTDTNGNKFTLESYFWTMTFEVLLGIRSMGAFMPLFSAVWSVVSSEDVDIINEKTSGLSPATIHNDFTPTNAAAKRAMIDTAMGEKTCRLMARARQIGAEERTCTPTEILV